MLHIAKITVKTLIKSLLFGGLFSLIVFISVYLYLNYQVNYVFKDRLLPGIIINSIDVSGFNKQQVDSFVDNQNLILLEKASITLEYPNGETPIFSAKDLNLTYLHEDFFPITYKMGRSLTDADSFLTDISQIILKKKIYLTVYPNYYLEPINKNLAIMNKNLSIEPTDAMFSVKNNKVVAFQIDTPGMTLNTDKAIKQIRQYLTQNPNSLKKPLSVSVESIELRPKVTIDEANDLGIVEEIGRGVSNFAHSASPRIFNIKLVSSRINGTLVPKGEMFSFNQSAGEISAQTGYQAGYAIISGQTVLSDGGGVCQESTTIFRAALNAGLPITQWKNHSYRVRYYENDSKPGFDATVYAPKVDFKFKNDTPAHILIQSEVSNGTILTVTLFGKSDGRVASISASRVWGVVPPPEPLYKDDPTLPVGTTKQVDYPAWGAKAAFDYKVIRGDEILQERTFTSVYRPWQAVFLVGKGQ